MSESVVEVLPCAGDEGCSGRSDYRRPLPPAVTRIPTRVELTTLTRMAKRPAVDIEFQDLSYTAGKSIDKVILLLFLFLFIRNYIV